MAASVLAVIIESVFGDKFSAARVWTGYRFVVTFVRLEVVVVGWNTTLT